MTADPLRGGTDIRWSAIVIGLFLVPLNSWWIMQMEAVYYSAHSTVFALFFNTICNLLVLMLVSLPLRKLSPRLRFSQGELLTIYIMLNLSGALVGHSMLQILPPTMAAPFGLATPENEWTQIFGQYIPTWLAVSDERTLEAYITGIKSAFRHSGVIMSWAGLEPFRRLGGWLSHPQPPNLAGLGFFGSGLLFGILLMFMRVRFIWWPFHPAGYAVSSTYGMRDYWSMFLLVWLVKWLILRHGGLRVHRQVLPLFFGMILGEFAIGGFWALIGVLFRMQTYNFTAWW